MGPDRRYFFPGLWDKDGNPPQKRRTWFQRKRLPSGWWSHSVYCYQYQVQYPWTRRCTEPDHCNEQSWTPRNYSRTGTGSLKGYDFTERKTRNHPGSDPSDRCRTLSYQNRWYKRFQTKCWYRDSKADCHVSVPWNDQHTAQSDRKTDGKPRSYDRTSWSWENFERNWDFRWSEKHDRYH